MSKDLQQNAPYTEGNCVYCSILFCVETLTVTADCRQYAQYLHVYWYI